ncbi:hypothetical protein JCM9140_2724 [Halalkalibacter wakoensis JCM 9140]|uniref:Uncharacterized protein n=1 Tax=Halalkalibacter wakoensis JCM 9140 TaxID=1236970 RepID=W4Q3W2_9BACI|nr:hypothetical protein [Halalkalibacter wakoensis]GAE26640.1 hypothetical protein JCM9140_2724 [Halalkalibacter wakoensis JCM 9140]
MREFDGGSLSAFLLLALLAAALSSYRFQFNINGDYLVYQVFILFNVPIWKKEIYPDQIKQLKFNEVWYGFKRAAVIKLNKGMNIRLSILEQREGYDHLLEFARKHNLEVYKTKDYLWLEERNR